MEKILPFWVDLCWIEALIFKEFYDIFFIFEIREGEYVALEGIGLIKL